MPKHSHTSDQNITCNETEITRVIVEIADFLKNSSDAIMDVEFLRVSTRCFGKKACDDITISLVLYVVMVGNRIT